MGRVDKALAPHPPAACLVDALRLSIHIRRCSLVEALDGIFEQFQPPFDASDTADNGIGGFAVATGQGIETARGLLDDG